MDHVPGLACRAAFILVLGLGCGGVRAELGQAQLERGVAVPLGSFEQAGLPVFVRAHEARLTSLGLVSRPVAFQPFSGGGIIEDAERLQLLEISMPETTGSTARSRWLSPSDQPVRPGALGRDPVDQASPFARSGILDGHATPDVELDLSKRATIGLFGEAGRIEPTDVRNGTVRPTRDLGAGVTLQYRFGE